MGVTRELAISYGGVTVGLGGTAALSAVHRLDIDPDRVSVEFEATVTAATAALFVTACQALEAAYKTLHGTLTITLSSQTWTWNPSANSGFNARPRIYKYGAKGDTARMRRYRCSVELELPAALGVSNGLRRARISSTTRPDGMITLDMSGEYTALSSNGARAQYTASYTTLRNATRTALGGGSSAWETRRATAEADDQDKRCWWSSQCQQVYADYRVWHDQEVATLATGQRSVTVRALYAAGGGKTARVNGEAGIAALVSAARTAVDAAATWEESGRSVRVAEADARYELTVTSVELLSNQSVGTLDNASIKDHQVSIRVVEMAPGDTEAETERPQSVEATYSCAVVATQTKDLQSLVTSTLLPFLDDRVRAATGASDIARVHVDPLAYEAANRISLRVSYQVPATALLESRIETEDIVLYGDLLEGVWDGDRLGYDVHVGHDVVIRTITETRRRRGRHYVDSQGWGIFSYDPSGAMARLRGAGWVPRMSRPHRVVLRVGQTGAQYDETYERIVTRAQMIHGRGRDSGARVDSSGRGRLTTSAREA